MDVKREPEKGSIDLCMTCGLALSIVRLVHQGRLQVEMYHHVSSIRSGRCPDAYVRRCRYYAQMSPLIQVELTLMTTALTLTELLLYTPCPGLVVRGLIPGGELDGSFEPRCGAHCIASS